MWAGAGLSLWALAAAVGGWKCEDGAHFLALDACFTYDLPASAPMSRGEAEALCAQAGGFLAAPYTSAALDAGFGPQSVRANRMRCISKLYETRLLV